MKNLLIIIMLLGSLGLTAQNKSKSKKEHKKELRENLTPEQRADLLSKKMTLELDLTDAQQKKVKQLFVDFGNNKPANRETRKNMTSEAKYAAKNAQLDRRIKMQRELKKILTPEQFETWENNKAKRPSRAKKEAKRNRRGGQ
jgi:Spy/CpxP family protein refolding chaperone